MGIRISKDHLHPSVIESITSLIGDLSQLETTAKGNAVEAINEILEKRDRTEELEAEIERLINEKMNLEAEVGEDKQQLVDAIGNDNITVDSTYEDICEVIKTLGDVQPGDSFLFYEDDYEYKLTSTSYNGAVRYKYTVPRKGTYKAYARFALVTSANGCSGTAVYHVVRNGEVVSTVKTFNQTGSASMGCTGNIPVLKGDEIQFVVTDSSYGYTLYEFRVTGDL